MCWMNREFCPSCTKPQCVRSGAERAGATCCAGRSQGTEQQDPAIRCRDTVRGPLQSAASWALRCTRSAVSAQRYLAPAQPLPARAEPWLARARARPGRGRPPLTAGSGARVTHREPDDVERRSGRREGGAGRPPLPRVTPAGGPACGNVAGGAAGERAGGRGGVRPERAGGRRRRRRQGRHSVDSSSGGGRGGSGGCAVLRVSVPLSQGVGLRLLALPRCGGGGGLPLRRAAGGRRRGARVAPRLRGVLAQQRGRLAGAQRRERELRVPGGGRAGRRRGALRADGGRPAALRGGERGGGGAGFGGGGGGGGGVDGSGGEGGAVSCGRSSAAAIASVAAGCALGMVGGRAHPSRFACRNDGRTRV